MAEFELTSDGVSWRGTFEATVRFVLDDLLSDGMPVDHVGFKFGDGRSHSDGTVTGLDSFGAILATGEVCDFDNIVSMTIN